MKLQKTIKVKIGKLSNHKKNKLNILIRKNTKAINFCLQKAKKGKTITHHLVYKDLRKMNLPATVIHGARAKSIEIIKSFCKRRKKKSKFPELKRSRVRFDNQIVKLRKTDNKMFPYFVSLLYKSRTKGKNNNRIELPLIVNSEYQSKIIKQIGEDYKLGATELVKYKDEFYVHISYSKEIELPVPDKSFSPIGIDVGINNLAVSVSRQDVKFFTGKRVSWKNNFFRKQRHKLISNFAYGELKRMKARQTRFNNHYINEISKAVIKQAKREEKPVIVMEHLKHIRDSTIVRKKQRDKHNDWVFRRLQDSIKYKANWEGIPVVYVSPKYTSQKCNKCEELNKRIKHQYKCSKCGYECNSDYNAGRNLQNLFKAICFKEQVAINTAFFDANSESNKTLMIGVGENLQERKELDEGGLNSSHD